MHKRTCSNTVHIQYFLEIYDVSALPQILVPVSNCVKCKNAPNTWNFRQTEPLGMDCPSSSSTLYNSKLYFNFGCYSITLLLHICFQVVSNSSSKRNFWKQMPYGCLFWMKLINFLMRVSKNKLSEWFHSVSQFSFPLLLTLSIPSS